MATSRPLGQRVGRAGLSGYGAVPTSGERLLERRVVVAPCAGGLGQRALGGASPNLELARRNVHDMGGRDALGVDIPEIGPANVQLSRAEEGLQRQRRAHADFIVHMISRFLY